MSALLNSFDFAWFVLFHFALLWGLVKDWCCESESHFSAATILVLPILLEKCGLGIWMILVHKRTLGRGVGRIAQWPRGDSSAERFTLFTTLEADSQMRALVLVYNLCLSNFHEVRRPVMKITVREMLGK